MSDFLRLGFQGKWAENVENFYVVTKQNLVTFEIMLNRRLNCMGDIGGFSVLACITQLIIRRALEMFKLWPCAARLAGTRSGVVQRCRCASILIANMLGIPEWRPQSCPGILQLLSYGLDYKIQTIGHAGFPWPGAGKALLTLIDETAVEHVMVSVAMTNLTNLNDTAGVRFTSQQLAGPGWESF